MAESYSLKAVLSAVDNLSPVLKSVNALSKNTRKYLGDVGSSLSSLAGKVGIPLGLVSGLAAGLGALAIKKYVTDFSAFSEAVMKSGFAMGMSNAEAQRMKYVAEQAGLQVESLQLSMGKLNKNLGAAGSGKNQDLEQLLKTLGVPLRGVNGQIRNAADMLPELAQAFVKNQDPVKQAAISTALFGKSYQNMLPFLNEGSEGIANSLARFKLLGDVVDDVDLKGAKAFGDQLQDLGFIGQNFQRMIARELVPVLGPLIERLIQWVAANKALISGEISKAVKSLVAALQGVDWAAFIAGVKGAFAGIGQFIDWIGGAKNALIALVIVMNLQTIAAMLGLIGAFGRLGLAVGGLLLKLPFLAAGLTTVSTALLAAGRAAMTFGLAMLANPIVLIALAIAAAALLIYYNWDTLKAWFGAFVTWMSGKWSGLLVLIGPLGAMAKVIVDNWEPLKAWFTSLFDWIGERFAWVAGVAGGIGRAVSGVFSSGSPGASSAASVAAGANMPATAPGALGSGSFNINAPATASLNGKVDIDFKNAPPGMMVTQAKADGPRVALNTNVGYRTVGTEGAF